MAKHEIAVAVSVNDVTADTMHTLRELTIMGLEAEEAQRFLDSVQKDIAPHYHKIVVDFELFVRNDADYKEKHNGDSVQVAEHTLEVLNGYIDKELDYLKKEHGWAGKRLPAASYRALRSIIGCLECGGSLLEQTTVSQCEKFASKVRKDARKAAADAHAEATGGGESGADNNVGAQTGLTDEQNQELAKLVQSVCEAYKMNPLHAQTLVKATTSKATGIVEAAMKAMAGKVANK